MNVMYTILKELVCKIVFDAAAYTIVLVLLLCVSGDGMFLFSVVISPCPLLSAILAHLCPPHNHLEICDGKVLFFDSRKRL